MDYLKEKIELKIAEAELDAQEIFINFTPFQKKFIVFGVLIIIPLYFVTKSIVYKASYSSYQKTVISSTPSFTDPKLPAITEVTITQAGEGSYAVAAKIVNENLDLALAKSPVQFVLYNQNHQVVYKSNSSLTLMPGETKYLILPRVSSTQRIVSAEVEALDDFKWQKKLSIPTVKLISSSTSILNQQNPPAFIVQGTVYNNSPYQLNQVDIGFLLRDKNSKIIGISQRSEFTLRPFEKRAYVQSWPGVYSNEVVKVDVLPTTNTLDEKNITLPASTGGASNLDR